MSKLLKLFKRGDEVMYQNETALFPLPEFTSGQVYKTRFVKGQGVKVIGPTRWVWLVDQNQNKTAAFFAFHKVTPTRELKRLVKAYLNTNDQTNLVNTINQLRARGIGVVMIGQRVKFL